MRRAQNECSHFKLTVLSSVLLTKQFFPMLFTSSTKGHFFQGIGTFIFALAMTNKSAPTIAFFISLYALKDNILILLGSPKSQGVRQ